MQTTAVYGCSSNPRYRFSSTSKSDFENVLMSGRMAVIGLSYLLGKPAKPAFQAHRGHFRSPYGIRTWAEACGGLFCTYSTNLVMPRAVYDLAVNGTGRMKARTDFQPILENPSLDVGMYTSSVK